MESVTVVLDSKTFQRDFNKALDGLVVLVNKLRATAAVRDADTELMSMA